MIGLIFSFINIAALIGGSISESIENAEGKTKYRHPNGLTYIDSKGRSRLISNDKIVMYSHDVKTGDWCLYECRTGRKLYNFTAQEKREFSAKKKEEAIRKNKTTYCIDKYDTHQKKSTEPYGKRFVDIKTNEVYVIREIDGVGYYLNIATKKFVRKIDIHKNIPDAKALNIITDSYGEMTYYNAHYRLAGILELQEDMYDATA